MSNFQVPRGTQDVFGAEITKWHYLEQLIRDLCQVYHYGEIRTPIFEHTEVFKRENDSSDMVNKEMYVFEDNGGRSLTLRPEGTAGVIRSYVEHKMYGNPDLFKGYYIAPNFRYERPQKGRMRIHHQFGVEVVGAKNPALDCEVIALGYSVVQAVGLKDLKVLINTLGDEESRAAYRVALKDHFAGHLDTLCPDCQRRYQQNPLRILDCKFDANHEALLTAPALQDYLNAESQEYFQGVLAGLDALEIPYEIANKLVRGLDYYCHTVFEVVSVNANMGSQSTVFGGGRYDKLVEYFGGPAVSGIGFGMGLERLMVACEAEGIDLVQPMTTDVYVMCLDQRFQHQALALATRCRAHGFVTEVEYLGRNFKAQFKAVERAQAQVVFIMGETEFNDKMITMKNVATQQQVSVPFDEMINQLDQWFEEGE